MTIAAGYEPDVYVENGATTLRAVNFPFVDDSDLVVTRTEDGVATVLELGVDYTVTGGSFATGTVTMTDAGTDATLEIKRVTPRSQEGNYGDEWPTETLEQSFDRTVLIAQELAYDAAVLYAGLARALLVPEDEDGLVIPALADRKGFYLKFNEDTGDPEPGNPAEDAVTPNFTFVVNIIAPDAEGGGSISGTFPDLTLTLNIPRGTAGLTGALANGTYGDIVVTDDGATLTIGANSVGLGDLVAAASAGFIGATGVGNYGHRTIAQVTAALNTFTDALKGLVPASGGGAVNFLCADGNWKGVPTCLPIACSDETTALSAGVAKVTFRMPYAMTGVTVRGSLTTAQTGNGAGGPLTIDVNESGASILSTKLTFDNGAKSTTTAAVAAVVSDANLADDAEITIDIDQIGDGTAKGLKIYLIGRIG